MSLDIENFIMKENVNLLKRVYLYLDEAGRFYNQDWILSPVSLVSNMLLSSLETIQDKSSQHKSQFSIKSFFYFILAKKGPVDTAVKGRIQE